MHHLRILTAFTFFIFAGFFILHSTASAQTIQKQIFLHTTDDAISIANNAYILKIPVSQKHDTAQILKLFKNPKYVRTATPNMLLRNNEVLYIGMVVKNTSQMSEWVLNFASEAIFPAAPPTSLKVWDGQTGSQINPLKTTPWSLAVNIPLNTSRFLVFEIKSQSSLSSLISPRLENQTSSSISSYTGFSLLLFGLLFVACGFAIIRLILDVSKSSILYCVSVGCLLLTYTLVALTSNAGFLNLLAHIAMGLSITAYAKGYKAEASEEMNYGSATRFSTLAMVIAFAGSLVLLLTLFISSVYIPIFFGICLALATLCLSIAAFLNLRKDTKHLSIFASTFLLFVATLIALATFSGSIPTLSTAFELPLGAGIALLISTILMSFSTFIVNGQSENTATQSIHRPDPLTEKIRDIRENYDHTRLLKVLDSERSAMQALQSRESNQVDAMRLAKAEADEANNAKSAFLAMVSHEIRTPMTGILGMVRFLKGTELSEQQKDYVDTVGESGNTIMDLLNDILDFEKIETGQMSLETIDFSVVDLMTNIFSLAKGYAGHKDLELVLDLGNKLPVSVKGDPTRLRQVILNLTNNAIKFTEKGHVRLHAKLIMEDKALDSEKRLQIYFAVEDTGIGISPEAQKNLFTPFKQADESTSRKYGGTGLGLAISQKLVDLMGGTISINSTLNQGSTFFFTLTLPAGKEVGNIEVTDKKQVTKSTPEKITQPKRPQMVETKDIPQKTKGDKHFRALVVDDNDITKKVISGFIEPEGFLPVLASSGQEALDLLVADSGFDVVFMDIEMPNMTGLEATEKLRSELSEPANTIPVIALTGNTRPGDVNACLSVGMNDFLAKPIDADALHGVLEKIKNGGYLKSVKPAQTSTQETQPSETPTPAKPEQTTPVEDNTPPVQAPVFDETQIASLKKALPISDLEEMMSDLQAKAYEILDALETANSENNHEVLRAKAHELKGMAGNFGLSKTGALIAEIESTIRSDAPLEQSAYTQIITDTKIALEEGYNQANDWLKS